MLTQLLVALAVGIGAIAGYETIGTFISPLKSKPRVVVFTREGHAVRGIAFRRTRQYLVLRDCEVTPQGAVNSTKADGEILLCADEVQWVQKVSL